MKKLSVQSVIGGLFALGFALCGAAAPQPANPGENGGSDAPAIEMKHVPLREGIRNLARQAGLNYILDPALAGPWRGKDDKLVDEPELTFQWPNLTPKQALKKLLKDYHLELTENPATSVARIVPAGKHLQKPDEQVWTSGGEPMPLTIVDDLPLLEAITRFAGQAHLIPTLDPKISATSFEVVLQQRVSVRWENITPAQALAALFDNYGLLLERGGDGKSARICIKPETEAEAQKLAGGRNSLHGLGSASLWPEETLYYELTSEATALKALNRVLKNADGFSAAILYVSCSVALRLHRLEDAGFLFYAGNIRTEFDKALFPPIGSGQDNPLVALGLLQVEMGNRLSPALMAQPQLFSRVSAKVKSWKPRLPQGFEPGWDYLKKGNQKQAEGVMADTRNEIVSQLSDLSVLLQNPTYFAAFKTAQDYNLKAADETTRPSKTAYDSACQVMEQIEKEKRIVGFAAAMKVNIARSDAPQPEPR